MPVWSPNLPDGKLHAGSGLPVLLAAPETVSAPGQGLSISLLSEWNSRLCVAHIEKEWMGLCVCFLCFFHFTPAILHLSLLCGLEMAHSVKYLLYKY